MITEGCEINGNIDFSVLFANVTVEDGADVKYSIVMPGTGIKKGAVVGESPENMADVNDWGVAVIGNGVKIGKGAKVEPKAMIDSDIGGAE